MDSNPSVEPNPYSTLENPFDARQKNLDAMTAMYPELQEIGRICYELFMLNKDGKKLWELLADKYLFNSLVDIQAPGPEMRSLYWSGFTDCLKFFKAQAKQHKQRIDAV